MKAPHLPGALQFVFGLAASSGMALLLSSGAMAASGASSFPTPAEVVPAMPAPAATTNDVHSTAVSSSTEATLTTTVHDVTGNGSDGTTGGSSVSLTSSSPSPVGPKGSSGSDMPMYGPDQTIKLETSSVVMPPTPAETPTVRRDDSAVPRTAPLPTVANQKGGMFYTASRSLGQSLMSGSYGLGALTAAASTPAAPQPTPMPLPVSGLLDRLTAVLAGVVVPNALTWLGDLPAGTSWPQPVLRLCLVALLGVLFVQSYGLWLRRAGFATAARSDAMTGGGMLVVPRRLGFARL
jgi:hypothetical protein